jgi:hypothetical protein
MSEQLRQPALIPAQPAVLVVGGRRIQVDEWPIAPAAAEYRFVELVRSDDSLTIRPKPLVWATQLLHPLVLAAAIGGVIAAIAAGVPWWLIAVVLAVLLIVFVFSQLTGRNWIRFDRRTKELVFERHVGFSYRPRVERTFPLESVCAVQLLYSGRHSITESHGDGSPSDYYSHRQFHGYELNLIVDDSSKTRLNLLCMADWKWIRSADWGIPWSTSHRQIASRSMIKVRVAQSIHRASS